MDCSNKIPPSGKPAQHHKVHRNCHTMSSSRHHQEDWHKRDRSRSWSRYSRHQSSSCCDSYRGHSRSQQRDGYRCYRNSSRQSHSAQWDHSHRSHHNTPHQPPSRQSTHCSSSGYHSQDHSRSHSHSSYRLSKYIRHHRGSHSSRSYSNQRTQKSHLNRNRKMHIEEPQLDFYSSDNNSTDLGEELESLN